MSSRQPPDGDLPSDSTDRPKESVFDESDPGFRLSDPFPPAELNDSEGDTEIFVRRETKRELPHEGFAEPDPGDLDGIAAPQDPTVVQIPNDLGEAATPPLPDPHTRGSVASEDAGLRHPRSGEQGWSDSETVNPMPANPSATVAFVSSLSQPGTSTTDERGVDLLRRALSSERAGWTWILLVSYASLATILLLFLLFTRSSRSHHLESLPDITPDAPGQLTFVPVEATLPFGHTLELGERRRFGNLLVEPLRVSREPLSFIHYTRRASLTREPSEPIWKLWVKFTNLSRNQTIVPLDRELLFRRITRRETDQEFSNQYLFPSKAKELSQVTFMYDLPPSSGWDLVGQNLGQPIGPGESIEIFLPTFEEPLTPTGSDFIWRVQFRKGQGPSGRGVTTVIDVAFRRDELQG